MGLESPKPVPNKKIPTKDIGSRLEGEVTSVNPKEVELLLDDGRIGVISVQHFGLNNEKPNEVLNIGDRAYGIELQREDPKNRVVISRQWLLKQQKLEEIEKEYNNENRFRGKVKAVKGQGLVIDIGLPAYLPASHLELEKVEDLNLYLDQVLEVKVITFKPDKEKIIVSRRAILRRQRNQETKKYLNTLKVGQIVDGVVESITNYGAFIDLGLISGLAHMSELSWDNVSPSEAVQIGEEVQVKILSVNVPKKRVSLSLKACLDDPLGELEVGSVIDGTVKNVTDFGAFIDLGSHEGLVHRSEISDQFFNHPSEILMPGESVRVKVLSVDLPKRRISLSIKSAIEFLG